MAIRNVEYTLTDDNKLLIEVDLGKDFGLSSSGKSRLIAVGSLVVKGGAKFSLTVYRPLPECASKRGRSRFRQLQEEAALDALDDVVADDDK